MRELTPLAIFGIDVGDLVGDVVRSLLDLLVPDFTGRWANRLVAWLVALPQVTDWSQFPRLNAFRRELTAVGYGLLSLSFAGAAMQAWAAGLVDGRPVALHALARAALAAGALATYPTLVGQLVLAVNHLTAAVIRHPAVADGINAAIGGAFVIGVVSSGLSLGLAAGALMAALFFLAAIFVMKIALTAMLCVLLVSGALVIALWPLPQGEGLARLWGAGLLAAVTIPVSWALVFAVVGLVASDSLVGGTLGPGLEAAVKPFVAVACLYLVYKTPCFLVAHARMVGVRLGGVPGIARGAPGESALRRGAQRQGALQRERFRRLGSLASSSPRVGLSGASEARTQAGSPWRGRVAATAVNAASAAGGAGASAGAVTAVVLGAARGVETMGRVSSAVSRRGKATEGWWRRPTHAGLKPAQGPRDVATLRANRSDASTEMRSGSSGRGRQAVVTQAPPRAASPPVAPHVRPRLSSVERTEGLSDVRDDLRAARARQRMPSSDLSEGRRRLD